tara:strand:- start:296 stop:1195 length:900 start_codon:yes stop_codon:yes gene_type:complete
MPKKKTNKELLLDFIDSVKDKVSQQTQKTYLQISNTLPFNVLTTQSTIIKKLNDLYKNPNTKALYLNMIILVRRHNGEETDKLIKFRNSLRDDIIQIRKDKMSETKKELPNYNELLGKLNELKGLNYIVNYLFVKHGLRNKDINLKFVSKIPKDKEDENYLTHSKSKAQLDINDYKTDKTFGNKSIIITDKRFLQELKDLKLKDGEYLIKKKNGDKLKISSFNERILNMSIDKLGEAKIFKVLIAHLLDKKDFKRIEELVSSRGTSISTIMKSYNIYNNGDDEKKNTKLKEEIKENIED